MVRMEEVRRRAEIGTGNHSRMGAECPVLTKKQSRRVCVCVQALMLTWWCARVHGIELFFANIRGFIFNASSQWWN